MITLIVAMDKNGAIGKDGDIPWRSPEDLASFKRETIGGAVIMGRRTWTSLPKRPLDGRLNCVISSDTTIHDTVFADPRDAIVYAKRLKLARIYGIGGARIYHRMLPFAHRLLITEIDTVVQDADTFFPDFDRSEWRLIHKSRLRQDYPVSTLNEYLRRRIGDASSL